VVAVKASVTTFRMLDDISPDINVLKRPADGSAPILLGHAGPRWQLEPRYLAMHGACGQRRWK